MDEGVLASTGGASLLAQRGIAEHVLRALVSASPLPIVTLDTAGNVTSWNPAAERTFGWTEAEVLGKPSPSVPDEQRAASDEVLATILEGDPVVGLERRRLTKDGSPIDLIISSAPLYDAAGCVIGTVVLAHDITERKRTEGERDRLLQREREIRSVADDMRRRFQFLVEASDLLSSSLDYEATLSSVARLAVPRIADWCAVHVVQNDGSVKSLATAHVDPGKVQLARDLEQEYPFDPDAPSGAPQVLRTGKSEVISHIDDELLEAVSPDPRILQILRELGLRSSMVVPMLARGRTLGTITFIAAESGRHYDGDDLALAEDLAGRAALAIDNARLYRETLNAAAERTATLAHIADGIVTCDADGHVVFANAAAMRFGPDESMLDVGLPVGDYIKAIRTVTGDPFPPSEFPVQRVLAGEQGVVEAEWSVERRDGARAAVQGSAAPILSETGARLGAVLSMHDVTAQRVLERQKDDFLAAAAHDLKNPLATIKTFAQMLRRRVTRTTDLDVERLVEGLDRIDTTATRMAALVNELLDVTRFQMGRPVDLDRQPTDLGAVIGQLVTDYQQATDRHQIRYEAAEGDLFGYWDALRLERALGNILSNAIKYSPNGGEVSVALTRASDGGEDWVVVEVQDQGVGIPETDLPHVFERFYRASNVGREIPGTGIGLAGACQIIEQHGGTIEARSEGRRGSSFVVRLPLTPEPSPGHAEGTDAGAG